MVGETELPELSEPFWGLGALGLQAAAPMEGVDFKSVDGGLDEWRPLTEVKAGAKDSMFFSRRPKGLEENGCTCNTVDMVRKCGGARAESAEVVQDPGLQ